MLLSLAAPAVAVTYSQEQSISTSLRPTDIAYLPSGPGFVVLDSTSYHAVNISMTGAIRSTSPVGLANSRMAYNSHDGNIYLSGTGPSGDELYIDDTNFVLRYSSPYVIGVPQALGAYYDPGSSTDIAVLAHSAGTVEKISAIDGTGAVLFTGPANPVAIACAPDITTTSATLAYILTPSGVSLYDLTTGAYRPTLLSGISSANAIAVESSGPHHLLFVGDGNQVKMFSPSTSVQDSYSAAGTITLPSNVRGIAVDDSEKLYVTTQGSSTIAVYSLRPGITQIDPYSGPTAGGTVVTITGHGFQNADSSALSVKFGSTPATGFVVDSDTQISAVAPAGAAGTVDITVDSPYGTSRTDPADEYTYIAPPTVTSVSPTSGPTSGGTSVTITGTGFTSGATVTCGGSSATGVNVVSATTITATTPAHAAGAVDIVVTSPGGTSATSSDDQFTYITPCSPAVALTAGGSLAAAVSSVCDSGTITVGPGTYRDYRIAVGKSVTIRAADGSGPADITIDGMQGGSSILTIAAGHTVVLDNLTFFNATGTDGGAVNNNGNLVVNSSAFRNCTAANGGAIFSTGTIGGIASSAFTDNTVVSSGGGSNGGSAIWNSGTITGITLSTFSGGTAIGSGLYGAAIYNSGSIGTISSSTFSGGRTDGGGGAIYNSGSIGTISSTTFSDNLAQVGGAILNGGTIGSLSGSIFNGGLALAGGAIANGGTITSISSTAFNNCRADSAGAGGAIYNTGTIDSISTTAFSGCTCGYYGGGIYNRGGTITALTSSAFTGCQGRDGGAIWNDGTLDIASGSFTGCSAWNGGAIFNAGTMSGFGRISITSSSFTGNSAADGGAIFDEGGISAINSASFTGNSATNGGAIWVNGGDAGIDTIIFSRFWGNTASTGPAVGISPGMGRIDNAENNWWGTNSGPAGYTAGVGTTTPWLVLNASAAPSSVTTVQTSTVLMKLTNNSAGDDTIVTGNVPDGIPVAYALSGVTGSLAPEQGNLTIGTNSTVFDPSSAGTATITVTVDGESVVVPVVVGDVPTTVPTTVPATTTTTAVYATLPPENDDSFPSVTPTASQAGTLPVMTGTVNIGGDSKAWQVIVTGTGLRDLIVTGSVQNGAGNNQTAPPGMVFQYISLTPARFTGISNAVIHFTVSQSWLDEHHIAPGSIVLYHQTANGWEALPTTMLYTKDGTVYFSAESTGFSLFAIAGTPAAATPVTVAPAQEISETTVQTPAPVAVTKTPVTTQTTAPPAPTPQPSALSPLLNIMLVIAAIGILTGGGFMARRW